ncbi:MAG: ParB/Srx family N-terminal domain-containing protein [Bdellovibrionales bacterium]
MAKSKTTVTPAQVKQATLKAAAAQAGAPVGVYEEVSVDKLKPYPKNARKHPEKQINALVKSIQEFGFTAAPVVNEDYTIMDGHGRVLAATKLGYKTIPIIRVTGLSPEQVSAYVLAANKLAETSRWDKQLVAEEYESLLRKKFNVEVIGFTAKEIKKLKPDVTKAALLKKGDIKQPISKRGDIWLLGEHRLIVGKTSTMTADAAVKRWEEVSGKSAVNAATGAPFGAPQIVDNVKGDKANATQKQKKKNRK